MDVLSWLDEIKKLKEDLSQLQAFITEEEGLEQPDYDKLADMYAKEFEISVLMSGAFEDCMNVAHDYRNNGNEFMARRIEKEALENLPYAVVTIEGEIDDETEAH